MHWWYMPSLFLNTGLKCLQHGWLLFLILFHQWNPSVCACLIIIIILSRNPLIWFGVWFVLKLHNFNEQLTSWLTTPTFWPLKVGWDGWWRGLVGWQQWHRLVRRQWCKDESSNTLPHSQHTGGELRRICDYSRQCSLFCRLHQNKAKC